jgi:hypothetical protein
VTAGVRNAGMRTEGLQKKESAARWCRAALYFWFWSLRRAP